MILTKTKTKKKRKKRKNVGESQAASLRRESWRYLEEAYRNDSVLKGRIASAVKGGLKLTVSGVSAFLPSEHVSAIAPRMFAHMKGQEIDVKILKLAIQGRRVFVSHDLVMNPSKQKSLVQQSFGARAKPKIKQTLPLCKRCGGAMSRSYSELCATCRNSYRIPVIRGVVQGGSPGLPKKPTLKIGKPKP